MGYYRMKKIILGMTVIFVAAFLAGCGIAPPTQDLNVAKAALAKAQEAKAEEFAKEEYAKADTDLQKGEKGIVPKKNKKNETAKKDLVAAKAEAEAAYKKAAPAYAKYNIDQATTVKSSAEDIKAQVALKDKFAEAKKLLDDSQVDKDAGNFESSWEKSIKAKGLFEEVFKITQEKKVRAESGLKDADDAVKNAESGDKEK